MTRFAQIALIARHTFTSILKLPINRVLIGSFILLIIVALGSSFTTNLDHQHTVNHYSQDVREQWEDSPDKHPHRMAHYGYIAFRSKYPLSFFDLGLDSYLGNAVFLEAHRQNSVNFSEISLSSGLLRFGELSTGLILQLLIPLLIFFWGFAIVADDRAHGLLKIFLTQGAQWSKIILGKGLGIFGVSLIILIPAFFTTIILLLLRSNLGILSLWLPLLGLMMSYMIFFFTMCLVAVWVSATSSTTKVSLIKLIGLWVFFTLIIPKLSQVAAQSLYPSPSKIELDTMVENELIKQGDSHNPDDPHYKGIRDSLLAVYQVDSPNQLPFNYSGFIMREGERLSTEIYRKHQSELLSAYQNQNNVVFATVIINPYLAIKHISMVLSGTDYGNYRVFTSAAENYRYLLAQTMNELQMNHIGNNVTSSADKNAVISRQNWKDFPPFQHDFVPTRDMFFAIKSSLLALLLWFVGLISITIFASSKLKAI